MNNHKSNSLLKIRFYVMSLWLLFFLVAICTITIPNFEGVEAIKQKIVLVLSENIFPIISILMCIVCFILLLFTKHEWKGVNNPPHKIQEIKNENYEYLTFLTTCIIPLVCIDFDNIRYIIVFCALLLVFGIIFIKMGLYYGNPTLAIMGYKIYKVKVESPKVSNEIIVITKDKLSKGASIKWIKMDEFVWVAKEIK